MAEFSTDPQRVVVAMSGGVDSSVAAALLVEQGYEVIGMMMRLWSEPGSRDARRQNRCCTPDQMDDARRVANQLRIPFYVLDVQELFHDTVVRFFVEEHGEGRTPNPCIQCNRQIRFTYLLRKALSVGAQYLATGHYARVQRKGKQFSLLKAKDVSKDQSYVLHVLGQEELAHVLFPVGDSTKAEVREMAVRFNLPVAKKSESMDLCFLSDGNYRRFLVDHSPKTPNRGPILTEDGQVVGQHEGLPFYTIGQRKGLGIAVGRPMFVVHKDRGRNALVVGSRRQLGRQTLTATDVNWISGSPPGRAIRAEVKIRYGAQAIAATVRPRSENGAEVSFDETVYGVTAGQGVVFYRGASCLGGGIITDEFET